MTDTKYDPSDFSRGTNNSWAFLKKMDVGESLDLREGRNSCMVMADRYGIKVTTKKLSNGDYRVTRTA